MKKKWMALSLAGGLAFVLSSCMADDQHVVGQLGSGGSVGGNPDSGVGSGGTSAGTGGTGTASYTLHITPEEAVGRLTQVLWNTDADAAFVAQQAPTITDRHAVSALAAQMLQDPRARPVIAAFYRWWLGLDAVALTTKDAALFPEFNSALATDMAKETETFGVNVTLDMNGTLSTLLTAPFSYVNQRLAPIYGVAGSFGPDFQQTSLNPQQRAGLLTHPGLQVQTSSSTRNSPTRRGKSVVERIMCLAIPAPPANVPTLIDGDALANSGQSLRQWLELHRSNAACAACHVAMDPVGYAFEGFDPIGRARTTDNGKAVDLTGTLPVDGRPSFNGPVQLGALLAASSQAQSCMVRQWLTFMLGRTTKTADEPAILEAQAAFAAAGFNLRAAITAVAGTEAFLAP